jgi:hypothetical protein
MKNKFADSRSWAERAEIEDLLTDYLHLLEQRLKYDDHHGDLSTRKDSQPRLSSGEDKDTGKKKYFIEPVATIFPKLRTAQIEYHVRDVQDMISWLKDRV